MSLVAQPVQKSNQAVRRPQAQPQVKSKYLKGINLDQPSAQKSKNKSPLVSRISNSMIGDPSEGGGRQMDVLHNDGKHRTHCEMILPLYGKQQYGQQRKFNLISNKDIESGEGSIVQQPRPQTSLGIKETKKDTFTNRKPFGAQVQQQRGRAHVSSIVEPIKRAKSPFLTTRKADPQTPVQPAGQQSETYRSVSPNFFTPQVDNTRKSDAPDNGGYSPVPQYGKVMHPTRMMARKQSMESGRVIVRDNVDYKQDAQDKAVSKKQSYTYKNQASYFTSVNQNRSKSPLQTTDTDRSQTNDRLLQHGQPSTKVNSSITVENIQRKGKPGENSLGRKAHFEQGFVAHESTKRLGKLAFDQEHIQTDLNLGFWDSKKYLRPQPKQAKVRPIGDIGEFPNDESKKQAKKQYNPQSQVQQGAFGQQPKSRYLNNQKLVSSQQNRNNITPDRQNRQDKSIPAQPQRGIIGEDKSRAAAQRRGSLGQVIQQDNSKVENRVEPYYLHTTRQSYNNQSLQQNGHGVATQYEEKPKY